MVVHHTGEVLNHNTKFWQLQLEERVVLRLFNFFIHPILFISFIFYVVSPFCPRLLIKNGNNIDSPPVYDSYEVEYLPNEGVLSTGRYLFVEFTTDGTMTSTGAAIRYEGKQKMQIVKLADCILSTSSV